MNRRFMIPATVLAGAVISTEAHAAAPPGRPWEISAGVLGLAGGNFVTTPDDVPGGYEGLGFASDAGGFGWGLALYGEGRLFEHLGLELRLGLDQSTLHRDVTYNDAVDVTERLELSTTRLGLMIKGLLPSPFGRLWLGLGPEFVLGASSDAENEITSGRSFVANASQVENLISAGEDKSVLMAFGLGMAFFVGEVVEIPIELRAAKNLDDETDWGDRVKFRPDFSYTVDGRSSWEFRFGIGVGARF